MTVDTNLNDSDNTGRVSKGLFPYSHEYTSGVRREVRYVSPLPDVDGVRFPCKRIKRVLRTTSGAWSLEVCMTDTRLVEPTTRYRIMSTRFITRGRGCQ